jgi:hypothetical protein
MHKLRGKTNFQGLEISIEQRKGDVRRGVAEDGTPWQTKMMWPYGGIRGTSWKAVDSDLLDCFIGPNPNATTVFVIHQQDPKTGKYDEDKCMLGFDTWEQARDAYLAHYDDQGFLPAKEADAYSPWSIEDFKRHCNDAGGRRGKLCKAYVAFGWVKPHARMGAPVRGYRQARHRADAAAQTSLFDVDNMPVGEAQRVLPAKPVGGAAVAAASIAETGMQALPGMAPADPLAGRGKRFTDVGEKIGGARKDVAELRRQFLADPTADGLAELEEQDPDAAARSLNKELMWPKPSVQAWRDAGRSAGWVSLARSTWEGIAGKPALFTAESRRDYLYGLEMIRDLVECSESEEQLADRLGGLRASALRIKDLEYYGRDRNNEVTDYDHTITAYLRSMGRIADWLVGKSKIRGVTAYGLMWHAKRGNWPQSEEERWDVINDQWGEKSRKPRPKPTAGTGDASDKWHPLTPKVYERKGDVEPIIIHTAADYLSLFGLRGVEFGNWMEDAASQVHVNRCAEAFVDLADTLGLKRRDVSLNGRLALAFGARGTGSASAHYEPGKCVINLTKLGGAGTLAHEWAHSLDDILHRVEPECTVGHATQMSMSALKKANSPVLQALSGVMDGIYNGSASVPHKIKPSKYSKWPSIDDWIRIAKDDAAGVTEGPSVGQRALEHVMRMYPSMSPKKLATVADYIAAKTGATELFVKSNSSAFFEDAKGRGDYWKRPHELFARAFETYIVDAMEEKGRGNNYLAYDLMYRGGPYPQGAERAKLKVAFDGLFRAIRETSTMEKALRMLEQQEAAERLAYMMAHPRAMVVFGVASDLVKAIVKGHPRQLASGKVVQIPTYWNKKSKQQAAAGQMSLLASDDDGGQDPPAGLFAEEELPAPVEPVKPEPQPKPEKSPAEKLSDRYYQVARGVNSGAVYDALKLVGERLRSYNLPHAAEAARDALKLAQDEAAAQDRSRWAPEARRQQKAKDKRLEDFLQQVIDGAAPARPVVDETTDSDANPELPEPISNGNRRGEMVKPGHAYWHVAGEDYSDGEPLRSWQNQADYSGEEPAWRWGDRGGNEEPFDTDIVSLHDNMPEAQAFQQEYGGKLLRVDIPEDAEPGGRVNEEGYPGIYGEIPADWITSDNSIPPMAEEYPEAVEPVVLEAQPEDPAADYAQNGTRAAAFKAWFGDWEADPANASKVVNADGEPQEQHNISALPKSVFHGTAIGGYDSFDPKKISDDNYFGKGFYFTEDRAIAEEYTAKDAKDNARYNNSATSMQGPDGQPLTHLPMDRVAAYRTWLEKETKQSGFNKDYFAWWARTCLEALNTAEEPEGVNVAKFMAAMNNPSTPAPDRYSGDKREARPADLDHFFKTFGFSQAAYNAVSSHMDFKALGGSVDSWAPAKSSGLAEAGKDRFTATAVSPPPEVFEVYLNVRNPYNLDEEIGQGEYDDLISHLQTGMQGKWGFDADRLQTRDDFDAFFGIPEEGHTWSGRFGFAPTYEQMTRYKQALRPARKREYDPVKQKAWMTDEPLHRVFEQHPEGLTRADVHYILTNGSQLGHEKAAINQWIRNRGHDGISHTGGWNVGTHDHQVWIAFEPTQIKAVDNEGTFDPSNPHLRKAVADGWIGVDLDGTLVENDGWKGPEHIGEPLARRIASVRRWLEDGEDVRIFTARADDPKAVEAINAFSLEQFGEELPVTNVKDPSMKALYDDRAEPVEPNVDSALEKALGGLLGPLYKAFVQGYRRLKGNKWEHVSGHHRKGVSGQSMMAFGDGPEEPEEPPAPARSTDLGAKLVDALGTTNSVREATFILPDGTMVAAPDKAKSEALGIVGSEVVVDAWEAKSEWFAEHARILSALGVKMPKGNDAQAAKGQHSFENALAKHLGKAGIARVRNIGSETAITFYAPPTDEQQRALLSSELPANMSLGMSDSERSPLGGVAITADRETLSPLEVRRALDELHRTAEHWRERLNKHE